jgi:uncharacterized protein (TIGR01777 family)
MNIVITGASGLIGTALSASLSQAGHHVYAMERQPQSKQPFHWWPPTGQIHFDPDIAIDAVINLAGAGIADLRWSPQRKQEIKQSRVAGTALLAQTLAQLPHKPQVLLSGSAIGFYGDSGAQQVDESSPPGTDYLADVATAWEQATAPAQAAGIRTVLLRTGVVLSARGGALQKMLLPFKLGLGGPVGDGRQYMSWVSLRDEVGMIEFLLQHPEISGAVNLVAPQAVTNAEFGSTMGKVLHRPALLPLPAFAAKLAMGEMAEALLLSSCRVFPGVLQQAGYTFQDAQLSHALEHAVQA